VTQIAWPRPGRGHEQQRTAPIRIVNTQDSHKTILDPRQVFLTPAEGCTRPRRAPYHGRDQNATP
jgi:hypothetical protein